MMSFCFVLVFILSLNGITEAFYFATCSTKQLELHNYRLFIFSIIYMIISLILVPFQHVYGFIFAQCVVMLLRVFTRFLIIKL